MLSVHPLITIFHQVSHALSHPQQIQELLAQSTPHLPEENKNAIHLNSDTLKQHFDELRFSNFRIDHHRDHNKILIVKFQKTSILPSQKGLEIPGGWGALKGPNI